MKFPLPALCKIVFCWKPLSSLMKFPLSALYKIVFLGAGKPLSRLQQAGVFAVGKPSTLESAIDRLVAFFFQVCGLSAGFTAYVGRNLVCSQLLSQNARSTLLKDHGMSGLGYSIGCIWKNRGLQRR